MTEVVDEKTGEIMVKPKVAPPAEDIVKYDPKNPVSLYMNGSVFHQVGLVARTMSESALVPEHLRGKPADCFLLVAQAVRWNMDPFAVAQSCYVARGKVGYEGKLIAALINARLSTTLNYEYSGKKGSQERTVVVSGTIKGEKKARVIEGSVSDWKTANDQWKTASMIDQMLSYRGAREWARRHMPEAVLGIYSDDEVQEIERTEAKTELGDVVDGLLAGTVTTEDDPPEITRGSQSASKAPEAEEATSPEPEPEKAPEPKPAPKKAPSKAKKAAPKPKPAPKPSPEPEPEPEPEPKKEEEAVDPDDQEIDDLFS